MNGCLLLQTYKLQRIYYGAGKAAVMAMGITENKVVGFLLWLALMQGDSIVVTPLVQFVSFQCRLCNGF